MFPRFLVIVPLINAFGGQLVASTGFTPSFIMAAGIAADVVAAGLGAVFTGSLTLAGVVGAAAGEEGGAATSAGF